MSNEGDGDLTQEQLEADLELPENFEELDEETQKTVKTAIAQKKHFRDKATKSQQDFENYKNENPPKETPKEEPKGGEGGTHDGEGDETKKRLDNLELSEKKRQFGFKHNLSPVEVDRVFQINPNPTEETLDDPFVRGGLKSVRAAQKAKDGTPPPSNSSHVTVPKKPLNKMSDSEKNEHLKNVLDKKKQQMGG